MGRLGIALLGPMQVTQHTRPAGGFEYDKVRALLAYLALESERPHRREALAGRVAGKLNGLLDDGRPLTADR